MMRRVKSWTALSASNESDRQTNRQTDRYLFHRRFTADGTLTGEEEEEEEKEEVEEEEK